MNRRIIIAAVVVLLLPSLALAGPVFDPQGQIDAITQMFTGSGFRTVISILFIVLAGFGLAVGGLRGMMGPLFIGGIILSIFPSMLSVVGTAAGNAAFEQSSKPDDWSSMFWGACALVGFLFTVMNFANRTGAGNAADDDTESQRQYSPPPSIPADIQTLQNSSASNTQPDVATAPAAVAVDVVPSGEEMVRGHRKIVL